MTRVRPDEGIVEGRRARNLCFFKFRTCSVLLPGSSADNRNFVGAESEKMLITHPAIQLQIGKTELPANCCE